MTRPLGILFWFLWLAPVAGALAAESSYKLGSGDILSIKVFGEPDLSFDNIRLSDAGTFPYPFVGEVRASGKTVQELDDIITRGLADGYLVNPRVTINVVTYRQVFVNGEVESPGGYPFQPGLTVRKALALAGGQTERASENKITIIREGDARQEPLKATLDTPVQPGDIVTIDESFF